MNSVSVKPSVDYDAAQLEKVELDALRSAVEAPVRPEDLRQGLEAFATAAMADHISAPEGFECMLEPTPSTQGLIAVMMHFSRRGWHGDNITAMGMRIRNLMEALNEYDWVAVNLFKLSEDHSNFEFDPRLIQAGAATRMRYDTEQQVAKFDKQDFINRLLYLLSNSSS